MKENKMVVSPGFKQFLRQPEEWKDPYYQTYRWLWSEAPTKGITTEYPLNLDVEVTNSCNLACPFCIRETMTDPIGFMSMETYYTILSEISGHIGCKGLEPAKVGAIKLNWRGEPTLHPDLVDMVGMAKACLVPEVAINTNGTRLTPILSKKLIEARIDRIIISVDSINPELYETQRVGAKLAPVIDNIGSLVRLRNQLSHNGRPYIRVQKVDLPESRLETEEYVDFWFKLGVDAVAVDSYKEKNDGIVSWEPNACCQPFQRLGLTWDGWFYPCCAGNLFPRIGHIKDMSVKTAWTSPMMTNLRKMHNEGVQRDIPQCRHCETTKPAED